MFTPENWGKIHSHPIWLFRIFFGNGGLVGSTTNQISRQVSGCTFQPKCNPPKLQHGSPGDVRCRWCQISTAKSHAKPSPNNLKTENTRDHRFQKGIYFLGSISRLLNFRGFGGKTSDPWSGFYEPWQGVCLNVYFLVLLEVKIRICLVSRIKKIGLFPSILLHVYNVYIRSIEIVCTSFFWGEGLYLGKF